jgi:hypothetical protein
LRKDIMFVHEKWQKAKFRDFLAEYWYKNGFDRLPSYQGAQNEVVPEVNHSRWLVHCPNRCGEATVVSEAEPYYICVNCGSPENEGQFYRVKFPPQRQAIEQLLMKRPPGNRNWTHLESVADLARENRERGVS